MAFVLRLPAFARPFDEGMWLPSSIETQIEGKMQALGSHLRAEDLYSDKGVSIKDAVVSFGGYCTGSFVSEEGLVLTNYHCGYSSIVERSSQEHNYVKTGFWAKTRQEELPNPHLHVSILAKMEDITAKLRAFRRSKGGLTLAQYKRQLISSAKGSHSSAKIESFYAGQKSFLLVYDDYEDVRLVGAPPENLGNFGKDTDNWIWPRHNPDFSVFRVYADKSGKPAKYSTSNVPLRPKRVLSISMKGLKENDFTLTYGFPARTDRYLTSSDLEFESSANTPAVVQVLKALTVPMKEQMDLDEGYRLQAESEYASLANTYKKYEGELEAYPHSDAIERLKKKEAEFMAWVQSEPKRMNQFGRVLGAISNVNESLKTKSPAKNFLLYRPSFIDQFWSILPDGLAAAPAGAKRSNAILSFASSAKKILDRSYLSAEKAVIRSWLTAMDSYFGAAGRPRFLANLILGAPSGNSSEAIANAIESIFSKSIFLDAKKTAAFLSNPSDSAFVNDPWIKMLSQYVEDANNAYDEFQIYDDISKRFHGQYVKGVLDWKKSQNLYPDANGTLRLSYGKVASFPSREGGNYPYFTSSDGIVEKAATGKPDYEAPPGLIGLLKQKTFGPYADADGTLHSCFVTNNDITGGNSGSPVLDADGNLVGLAFDGVWEGMLNDKIFDNTNSRTIAADIRQVLWVIDIYAHAGHLIHEMKFTK